jgi:hypothetical protein
MGINMSDIPKSIQLAITESQVDMLKPFFSKVKQGCSVMAQVYPDGFIVTFLNEEEAKNVADALKKTRGNFKNTYAKTLEERTKVMSNKTNVKPLKNHFIEVLK